ncbi:hypothetical protein EDB92DRAFT_1815316 [Lactarius akahatsu]|uniref:Uncharacterized protein n=1 Tax=Lactarius akahatsu TaxID=416441 RepID=A0AAD4LIK2_9AGAM|nr:hypothetical protein EDB92DRAFT_1815316 [Lactarius akahatsu]
MSTSRDSRVKRYQCDCSRYCKRLRHVSRATFYAHRKYRNEDCYGSLLPIRANAYSSQPLGGNASHALHSGGSSSNHQRTGLYSSDIAPCGKRARLDSGHRTSREPERLADEQAQEGHYAYDTGPTQKRGPNQQTDDGAVEPLGGEPRADSCTTSHPSQHMTLEGDRGTSPPDRGRHDASRQGDENVCHGRDDLPGGPNDWSTDNIVPRLEAPRISVDFDKCLGRATSEDDHISADVREGQQSLLTESLSINRESRLCLELFLATIDEPEHELIYNNTCAAIRDYSPDSVTLSYGQTKRKIAESRELYLS